MSLWEYSETELWRHGEQDISLFHVFGLTSSKNYVWCFAEARYGTGGDADCAHDIWMRRSCDGGRSFEPSVCLIPSSGKVCLTNPTPIYDSEIEKLFLFYAENIDNGVTLNYWIASEDNGDTWSSPVCITNLLENWDVPLPFHLPGPGHGIQIQNGKYAGRLVMPIWSRRSNKLPIAERGRCVSTLLSDDHGVSWHHTQPFGQECMANESRIVETQHDLLRIIRSGDPCRYESRSLDGGMTWSPVCPQAIGPAQNCDAGAVAFSAKEGYQNLVVMSRVSRLSKRWDMELCISFDGGRTFPNRMELPRGDAMPGYSDLCIIQEEEIILGLLHCRNNHVLFSRISLQTLTGGMYEGTQRKVWLW